MTKGQKLAILVLLAIGASQGFAISEKRGPPQLTAFFAFSMLGLLIAIVVIALCARGSRRK